MMLSLPKFVPNAPPSDVESGGTVGTARLPALPGLLGEFGAYEFGNAL